MTLDVKASNHPSEDTFSTCNDDEMIPAASSSSVCIFSTYVGKRGCIKCNTFQYICQLCPHFDEVIVTLNDDCNRAYHKSLLLSVHDDITDDGDDHMPGMWIACRRRQQHRLPRNTRVLFFPNKCFDFGMFWRVLRPLVQSRAHGKGASTMHRVALVNDSCYIVRDLEDLFRWASATKRPFWGPALSNSPIRHLQSFFLVFDTPQAVDLLFKFVAGNDVFKLGGDDKDSLIRYFELGLSVFMRRHQQYPESPWMKLVDEQLPRINPAHFAWDLLLRRGFPLLKKKRQTLSLSPSEYNNLVGSLVDPKYTPDIPWR